MRQIDGENCKSVVEEWSVWPDVLPSLTDSLHNSSELSLVDESDIACWELVVPVHMRPNVAKALACADVWTAERYGRASRAALRSSFEGLLVWACEKHDPRRSTFDHFSAALFYSVVNSRFLGSRSSRDLSRELRDERERDAAVGNPKLLRSFVERWRSRLQVEMSRNGGAWHIPEMSPVDARESLLLEVTAAIMNGGDDLEFCARAGYEATYRFLASFKDRLRAQRRIYVPEPGIDYNHEASPSPELLLITAEQELAIEKLQSSLNQARAHLTKPANQWLSALLLEAKGPGKQLNLARVANNIGRHRSSAVRAIRAIREALASEGYYDPRSE